MSNLHLFPIYTRDISIISYVMPAFDVFGREMGVRNSASGKEISDRYPIESDSLEFVFAIPDAIISIPRVSDTPILKRSLVFTNAKLRQLRQ